MFAAEPWCTDTIFACVTLNTPWNSALVVFACVHEHTSIVHGRMFVRLHVTLIDLHTCSKDTASWTR